MLLRDFCTNLTLL